ncbi:MAG: hypothetical protein U5K30_09145 [Acidimicrobiales bacterium]|nr:hypothetical protein [Acidimicrobiales bacterium]
MTTRDPSHEATPAVGDAEEEVANPPRWAAVVLFLLIVVAFPVWNVGMIASQSTTLSVLDEYAHVDVLRRVDAFGYPRIGERILDETARDVGCRGILFREVGTCSDPPDVLAVDARGYSFQAQQPPGYYIPTAVLRRAIAATPADDFVLTARLTGAVWLIAGLAALWWVLARLGVGLWARASAVALVAASPLILYQSSTVTNDAAVILIGAAFLYATATLDGASSGRRVAVVGAGVVTAVLMKPTVILGVAALSLAVLVRGLRAAWGSRRAVLRLLVVAAIPSVLALGAVEAWEQVRDERAVEPYDDVFDTVLGSKDESDSVTIGEAAAHTDAFLGVYDNSTTGGPTNDRDYTAGLARIGTVLLVAGPFSALVLGGDRESVIGSSALVIVLTGSVASVFQYHSTYGIEGGAPARYAFVLIPFLSFALGRLIDHRRAGTLIVATTAGALMIADVFSVVNL